MQAQPTSGETTGAARVEFSRVTADHGDIGDVIENAIDGRADTHWSIHPRYGEPHEAVFEFKEPISHASGTTFIIRLECNEMVRHQLGRFRLSFCTDKLPIDQRQVLPATITDLVRKDKSWRTHEEDVELAIQVRNRSRVGECAGLFKPL